MKNIILLWKNRKKIDFIKLGESCVKYTQGKFTLSNKTESDIYLGVEIAVYVIDYKTTKYTECSFFLVHNKFI